MCDTDDRRHFSVVMRLRPEILAHDDILQEKLKDMPL